MQYLGQIVFSLKRISWIMAIFSTCLNKHLAHGWNPDGYISHLKKWWLVCDCFHVWNVGLVHIAVIRSVSVRLIHAAVITSVSLTSWSLVMLYVDFQGPCMHRTYKFHACVTALWLIALLGRGGFSYRRYRRSPRAPLRGGCKKLRPAKKKLKNKNCVFFWLDRH